MTKNYFLPVSSSASLITIRLKNLQKGRDYYLIFDRMKASQFSPVFSKKHRLIVVCLGLNRKRILRPQWRNSIVAQVDSFKSFDIVLEALNSLFPESSINLVLPRGHREKIEDPFGVTISENLVFYGV